MRIAPERVFLHYSEDSVDIELRRAQTFCKGCDAYAWVRLVERVRTVSLYWVIKQTDRKHFLICGACEAQFRVKPHNKDDIEQADIHTLLGMSGDRYVPFSMRVILFLALITLWVPLVNLMFVWALWKERARLPPDWLKWVKYLFWAGVAMDVAFVLGVMLD